MELIQGTLDGFGFARIARFVAELNTRGMLYVACDGWHGHVWFEPGRPVAGTIATDRGLDALEAMASIGNAGRFSFCDDDVKPDSVNVELGAAELWTHLDDLQARGARFIAGIPAPGVVPIIPPEAWVDGATTSLELTHAEISILSQIDGKRTVGDLAARYGLARSLRALAGLVELDLVQFQSCDAQRLLTSERVLVSRPRAVHCLLKTDAGKRLAVWASTLAVVFITLLVHGHRLSAAPDFLADEGLYLVVANSLAHGAGLLAPGGALFLWHPPLYFVVESAYIKIAGLADVDLVAELYQVRYLNIVFSALTAGLLMQLGRKTYRFTAGLLMATLFLVDPYVQRINRRSMLETLAMLLALCGLYLFFSMRERVSIRRELLAGVAFGLAVLTKELMLFEVLAIIAFTVWSNRQHLASALRTAAVACSTYLVYPMWVSAIGQGDAFLSFKLQRLGVFLSWSKYWGMLTGQSRPVVPSGLTTGSGAPFIENILAVLGQYATSYLLILLGGILTVVAVFLLSSSTSRGARYIATWSATSYAFIGFGLVFGTVSDQFFYYLVVPAIGVVSCGAAAVIERHARLGIAVVVALAVVGAYDGYQWLDKYHFGVDNAYATIFRYVEAHVTPGETIAVGNDVSNYLLPGYQIAFHRDSASVIASDVHFFILSSKDPWGGFHGMTPQFYTWALQQSRPVIERDENTYWRIGLYYRGEIASDAEPRAYGN